MGAIIVKDSKGLMFGDALGRRVTLIKGEKIEMKVIIEGGFNHETLLRLQKLDRIEGYTNQAEKITAVRKYIGDLDYHSIYGFAKKNNVDVDKSLRRDQIMDEVLKAADTIELPDFATPKAKKDPVVQNKKEPVADNKKVEKPKAAKKGAKK